MNSTHRTRRMIRPLVLTLVLAGAPAVAAASNAQAAAPFCGIYWGSLEKTSSQMPAAAITNVRAGRHACFDRMVVDINGKHVDIVGGHAGYDVRYVRDVFADPSDQLVSLRGGAKLQVAVRAHTEDVITGLQVFRPANANELVNVNGFSTFRQIKLIGPSFEGVTQIGLGVRARLPFRVFTLDGPGAGSRLVIDVAHHWWPSSPTVPGQRFVCPRGGIQEAIELQRAVDQGHQPWRTSPTDVATACTFPDGAVEALGSNTYRVTRVATGQSVIVEEAQPVRSGPAGIWVVTKVRPR